MGSMPIGYRKRKPRKSPLFRLLGDHWDAFTGEYDELFAPNHGEFRRRVGTVVGQFQECGIPDYGFVRIRCEECHAEHLLPFSCKSRGFCPSCAAKRECFFAEFLQQEVLAKVTHRHVVFTIPKRLRGIFLRDRHLLPELSRIGYESVLETLREQLGIPVGRGAAVIASQTFGSLLDFTPHAHALFAWGLFEGESEYTGACESPRDVVEDLFRHKVFTFLLERGLISEHVIESMLQWNHSGFSVFIGPPVYAYDTRRIQQLAGYIVRGPVALSRLKYDRDISGPDDRETRALGRARGMDVLPEGRVTYKAGKEKKRYGESCRVWTPFLFLLDLIRHIPERHQKMVNYYGWYSNRSRGDRKKKVAEECDLRIKSSSTLKSLGHWRRFIKLVYEVDPLICPNCHKEMQVVSWIHEPDVVFRILNHTDLLDRDQEWKGSGADPPVVEKRRAVP